MSEPVRIKPCAEPDIAAIREIYADAVLHGTASFETEPPSEAEMLRRWRVLEEGGFPYLIAARGSGVVGYAYCGPWRTRPAYRATVESSVYVADGARGEGVGRALMQALIGEAEARGFRQMLAVIGDSGNLASIRLHEALGFGHVGVLRSVGWKAGGWLDTVLMQRALGPGDAAPLASLEAKA